MQLQLAAIRPALAGLCGVAELVLRGAALPELWAALSAFAQAHLRTLQGSRMLARLKAVIAPLCADAATRGKAGPDALALLEEMLLGLRQGVGRYGEARLYIGSVTSPVRLPFTSVRILGLSEGRIPALADPERVLSTQYGLAPKRTNAMVELIQNTKLRHVDRTGDSKSLDRVGTGAPKRGRLRPGRNALKRASVADRRYR